MECPYCDAEVEIKKGWYGKKSLKDRFYLQAWEVVSFDKVILHEAIVCCDDWSQWEEYDGPKYIYKYDLRSTELTPGKTVTTRWSGKQFKKMNLYKIMKVKFANQGEEASTSDDSGVKFNGTALQGEYKALINSGDIMFKKKKVDPTTAAGQQLIETWFGTALGGITLSNAGETPVNSGSGTGN